MSEDIVRTIHITKMKVLNIMIKSIIDNKMELIVFHDKKLIIPIDLKTSCSCEEKDFYLNWLKWHY